MNIRALRSRATLLMAAALVLTCLVYWPGLGGGWFFDDYPNIVDNADVQPERLGARELLQAARSSPASALKRPLASLSFVASHAMSGLDPFGWKLANLVIHLCNGVLLFVFARVLFAALDEQGRPIPRAGITAALIAGGWLLLPINLTAVLLVVQRMESLANVFVVAGLAGYVQARRKQLLARSGSALAWGAASLVVPTAVGALVKESAVLLPLYAFLVECIVFRFRSNRARSGPDRSVVTLFVVLLALPATAGLAWILPRIATAAAWSARDFTMWTRLLSEARIIIDYIGWILLPLPQWLSFYHDHFRTSTGLLTPWTTLASLAALIGLVAAACALRRRYPLVSLGIALYLTAHVLTGTILPLELIYEHRNYFASFGVLLAVVPILSTARYPFALARHATLALLLAWWAASTLITAYAWGDPLRLAVDLAARAPDSPRAQFGLGRELVTKGGYDPNSPFTKHAYAPLLRASSMPGSSILPEQMLILMNSLMHRPVDERWWEALIVKLRHRAPGAENVSALGALTRCASNGDCVLPAARMQAALDGALDHNRRDPRLLTIAADYAWSVSGDRQEARRLAAAAVAARPGDADYRITLARMDFVLGRFDQVRQQLAALEGMRTTARQDASIAEVRSKLPAL
ncbi:hypothetical protein [Dokdonella sp.]|uniref:hypothetical protein n=1 Tax=Dokdonella sp. TaxID=2291710 RepID=UPI0031C2D2DB|nr:hypothetical protein [Dokdonella sp.]